MQGIRRAQIEIGGGERPLCRELGIVEIGGAGLGGRRIAFDLAAHLAPDIDVPGAGKLRHEGCRVDGAAVEAGASARARGSEAGGLWPGARAGVGVTRRHRWKQRRLRLADEGARLLIAGSRGGHRLVRDFHLLEQESELGIAIEAPPIAAVDPVARRGQFPAFDLLVLGRRRRGFGKIVGADAAAGKRQSKN